MSGYIKCESKQQLLSRIDNCESIAELFVIVREEDIDMRMRTLCSASCVPPKMFSMEESLGESPLSRLKASVRFAVENFK